MHLVLASLCVKVDDTHDALRVEHIRHPIECFVIWRNLENVSSTGIRHGYYRSMKLLTIDKE